MSGATLQFIATGEAFAEELGAIVFASIVAHVSWGFVTGLYRYRWRVSSFDEVAALGSSWIAAAATSVLLTYVLRLQGTELTTASAVAGSLLAALLLVSTRTVWRRYWEKSHRPIVEACHRTIVFGAGDGGAQIIKAMLQDPESAFFPVALLDDDPTKSNRELEGVPVRGGRDQMAQVAKRTNADTLLIAIPTANSRLIGDLAKMARELDLDVRVLPSTSDLFGRMTVGDVRAPTVDDLLGRDPVEIDLGAVAGYIRGRSVLITGAGGSIGSELARQVRGFAPSKLFLLDRDESALHGVQLSMEGRALLDTDMLVVADIRDRPRVFELFEQCRPDVVFHTAALKHLTLLENHPEEGLKTNVFGTQNLLDAATKFGVDRFVNISTDKAADPTSVLGATKLAAERFTAKTADQTGRSFLSVRFGNVLGSRGSVLPTFLGQIEQGKPLTVTDPEVTRFFMTIPEAVRLVVQAGAIGSPGEVLILDMGEPVKIVDLAQQLITLMSPTTTIEFTGLRPGEKMHEVLTSEAEDGQVRFHPRIRHTTGQLLEPADALRSVSYKLADLLQASVGHATQSEHANSSETC